MLYPCTEVSKSPQFCLDLTCRLLSKNKRQKITFFFRERTTFQKTKKSPLDILTSRAARIWFVPGLLITNVMYLCEKDFLMEIIEIDSPRQCLGCRHSFIFLAQESLGRFNWAQFFRSSDVFSCLPLVEFREQLFLTSTNILWHFSRHTSWAS